MSDTADPNAANTHCPGCGQHQLAVGTIIAQPDGTWKCHRCIQREAVMPPPGEQMVPVTCPLCAGQDRACSTCAGLGKVRVPMSKLSVYDTGPQLLTEETQEGSPAR